MGDYTGNFSTKGKSHTPDSVTNILNILREKSPRTFGQLHCKPGSCSDFRTVMAMSCLKDDIPEQTPRTQAARTKQTNEDAPDMQRTTPSEKAAKFCSRIVPSQHNSRNYLVVHFANGFKWH